LLRAIVFDFDGVIANSEPLHYQAFHDVLADWRVDFAKKEYYDRYLGYDDAGVFRAVSADRGLGWTGDRISALVNAKAETIERLEQNASILFPGAAAAVRRAAALMPLAIASGALRAEILRVLDREGLSVYFKAIVAAEDTPLSKPAAAPYRLAIDRLAVAGSGPIEPAECVAIEDSPWGLQSAKAAGLRTVGVAQTYDAAELDADLVTPSVGDLNVDGLARLCAI
jgi:HAD superfamily hydrolase (TIGR01509 family)